MRLQLVNEAVADRHNDGISIAITESGNITVSITSASHTVETDDNETL